jgi:thiosulfate reductase cytochrome b subunit
METKGLVKIAFIVGVISAIGWVIISIFDLINTAVANEPWLRIFHFIVALIGLGFCIYGLVKLSQNKIEVSNSFSDKIILWITSLICLGVLIYEILYFVTNIL